MQKRLIWALAICLVCGNGWAMNTTNSSNISQHEAEEEETTRDEAIAMLTTAIAAAEQAQTALPTVPTGFRTSLATAITAAKTMRATLDQGGFLAGLISTQRIIDTAESLTNTVNEIPSVSAYFVGSKEEVSNVDSISSTVAMKAITTAARSGLEMATNTAAMKTALSTMQLAVAAWLQTRDTLEQGLNMTGVVANHSFDRGSMDGWMGLSIDASKIDITKINLDNLGSLASAISFGMDDGTAATRNDGSNAMEGVHGAFYLNSSMGGTFSAIKSQPVAQVLMGLPAGTYSLTARMAVSPGLFHTNNGHLIVGTLASSIVQDILGNIDLTNIASIGDSLNLTNILPLLLQNGQLKTAKGSGSNIDTWTDVTLDFDIDKNDMVLVAMSGGLVPIVGTTPYRADNIQLTYLHAPEKEEEEETSIDAISQGNKTSQTNGDGQIYDLTGRPATVRQHGIFISKGKKFVK